MFNEFSALTKGSSNKDMYLKLKIDIALKSRGEVARVDQRCAEPESCGFRFSVHGCSCRLPVSELVLI